MVSRVACGYWGATKARISPAAWTHLAGGDSAVTHRLLADSKNIPAALVAHVSGISGVGALQLHLASFPMNMQRLPSSQVAQSWSGAEAEQRSQVLLWRCELLALNIHVVHILYLGRCFAGLQNWAKVRCFSVLDAVIFGCSVSSSRDRFTDKCNFCFAWMLFSDFIRFYVFAHSF